MDDIVKVATTCTNCGGADVELQHVKSALWEDDRLVVVEDIPALVCVGCGERYFDDTTVVVLDLLRGEGFPTPGAKRFLHVPVFSFADRLERDEP